eukprot:CAMPEP_0203798774 /NCGR_PEP_ID=MMETSP0100_2-20121128/9500_1 /ASSEMBLY_ACC=CAM_ASM_000210 /TAXON_ID=96639 /ORGANISM=" , Strain NY0313808BC1" /LENGTH=196 /DNA_ID=CAMNT_0050704487 /DNA_START=397 /DNA_END=987 /DNA_ORIENTATION=+
MMLNQREEMGDKQLDKAIQVVSGALRDGSHFFESETWQPKSEMFTKKNPMGPSKIVMIVSRKLAVNGMPVVRGELYVDPNVMRKKTDAKRKSQVTKPKQQYSKQRKQAKPFDPMIAFRVYDPALLEVANRLKKIGLVARVLETPKQEKPVGNVGLSETTSTMVGEEVAAQPGTAEDEKICSNEEPNGERVCKEACM